MKFGVIIPANNYSWVNVYAAVKTKQWIYLCRNKFWKKIFRDKWVKCDACPVSIQLLNRGTMFCFLFFFPLSWNLIIGTRDIFEFAQIILASLSLTKYCAKCSLGIVICWLVAFSLISSPDKLLTFNGNFMSGRKIGIDLTLHRYYSQGTIQNRWQINIFLYSD